MDSTQMQQILARLDANDERLGKVDERLGKVEATGKRTEEILDYMSAGIRVMGGLGAVVRWGASIVTACIGLYYAVKKG